MTERPTEYVSQDALKIWTRLPEEGIESIVPADVMDGLSSRVTFAGEAAGTFSNAVTETPAAVLPDDSWERSGAWSGPWSLGAGTAVSEVMVLPTGGPFDETPWLVQERQITRTKEVPGSLDELLRAARSVEHAVTAFTEHFTARQRVRSNPGLDEQVEELVDALLRGARVLASLRAS